MNKTDNELVQETLGGRLSAFEILVKRYQELVLKRALFILKDKDAASDVAQEAFLRTFKNLYRFDLEKPFKSWLYKITTNLSIDYLRHQARLVILNENIAEENEGVEDKVMRQDKIEIVRGAIRELPKLYQNLIIGYYFWEMDYKTLAVNFSLPINTVRSRLSRAKKILKEELYGKV